jgi:hypothetical protein
VKYFCAGWGARRGAAALAIAPIAAKKETAKRTKKARIHPLRTARHLLRLCVHRIAQSLAITHSNGPSFYSHQGSQIFAIPLQSNIRCMHKKINHHLLMALGNQMYNMRFGKHARKYFNKMQRF